MRLGHEAIYQALYVQGRGSLRQELAVEQALAQAARSTEATGFKVFFCVQRSPWQCRANENTNGLLRQYFPKGTDFSAVTDEEVRSARDQVNGRPRETLGWRTPAEALAKYLSREGGALTA